MKLISKRLFTVLLSAILLLAALPLSAGAADIVASGDAGEIGYNVSWTVTSDGVLTISGTGATKDYSDSNFSPFNVVDKVGGVWITEIVIEPGVTRLGDYLFYYVPHVEKVTIPDTVVSIGMQTFSTCAHLDNVVIPDSVTSIGNTAFSNCNRLTSITLSKNITSIPAGLLSHTNVRSVAIPEGVTAINVAAFSYCNQLTSVSVPASVGSIGNQAFNKCSKLKYVFFGGQESEWQDISVGSYNEALFDSDVIMHYNAAWHTPVFSEKQNETPANCVSGAAYDEIDVCSLDGCDYVFPAFRVENGAPDPDNHVNTVDVAETDSTETEHGYTAGVYCNDCKQYISGHEEKPLLVPDEPVTVPDEPVTVPDEPVTVPDEPVTVPDEPVTVPDEPATEPNTEPTAPATEPATEPTTAPAAPTGAIHGEHCFCYNYTGNGLFASIVRFICAVYNFMWNMREAVKF